MEARTPTLMREDGQLASEWWKWGHGCEKMDWPWGMKRRGVKDESKLSRLNNQMGTGFFIERGS